MPCRFSRTLRSWQVILDAVPIDWRWARCLYGIRMVGEGHNNITPLGSLGGKPVNAWLVRGLDRAGIGADRAHGDIFIPAGLGSQEGTLLLVCQPLTGNPASALLLRRCAAVASSFG